MIARWFGEFILRKRLNAILAVVIFGVLTLVPPFSLITGWLSMVTVVVITLAKGPGEGLLILMWSLLLVIVLGFTHHAWALLVTEVVLNGVLWLLAIVYQRTGRLSYVIPLSVLAGLLFVIFMYTIFPDPSAWILGHLTGAMQGQGMELDPQRLAVLERINPYLVGIKVWFAILVALFELVIGVTIYSLVKKRPLPGSQLCNIRLHYGSVVILGLFTLLALTGSNMIANLLVVIKLPFFIAGMSLIHAVLSKKQRARLFLWAIYIILFILLITLPLDWSNRLIWLLVLLAVADSFVNLRRSKWLR